MADRLRLRVYTPERTLVDRDVREVTAQGALGTDHQNPHHDAASSFARAITSSIPPCM